MGLDWRVETWPSYQMALAGWNANQDGDEGPKDFTRLKKAMDAHTVH